MIHTSTALSRHDGTVIRVRTQLNLAEVTMTYGKRDFAKLPVFAQVSGAIVWPIPGFRQSNKQLHC